ncbi:MAG: hypothetical protein KY443_09985 [Actinobacteria bacterium]|nr:hypothetical protein [Actinomycetota bacterium]
MTYESALADAWPAVTRVIEREVRRLQVPAHAVDDLVQATAEVVLRKRPAFVDADDLAPYVRIVARHKALRWVRSTARETVGLPELVTAQSVAEVARLKLLAAGTLAAYERLEPVQRDRLSRYLAGERAGNSVERARERKRIERIRVHMAQAIERIAAVVAGWRRFVDVAVRPEMVAAAAIALFQAVTGMFVPSASATSTTVDATLRPSMPAIGGVTLPAVAMPVAVPAPVPSSAPLRSTTRQHEELVAPREVDTPVFMVTSPTGKSTGVLTTPNSEEKPIVCVSGWVNVCVDKPFTL